VFPVRQVREDAIPEAENATDGRGSRLWFAVQVPSPYILETPTPLDISQRPNYLPAARSIRFAYIPAEVVPHPAGLPRLAPDHFESWFNLGVGQQKLSNIKRAAEAYEFATNVRPDSWERISTWGFAARNLVTFRARAPRTNERCSWIQSFPARCGTWR
jgi:hypothetical protein